MSTTMSTLTVADVARVLNLSRTRAYEAVARGEVPSVRIGRSIRIPEHRLRELLDGERADERKTP